MSDFPLKILNEKVPLIPQKATASLSPKKIWERYSGIIIIIAFASAVLIFVMGFVLSTPSELVSDSPGSQLCTGYCKIAGTDCYVAGGDAHLIVLLPDIFGMSSQAVSLATSFAQGGFTVILIDYFNGDVPKNTSDTDWFARHPANLSLAATNAVLAEIAQGYTSIQAQGYCYGGRIGVSLSFNNTVKSVVVAHPSLLVANDSLWISQPIFFEQAETDTFNAIAPYFQTTLNERGIPNQFKIYPNTSHGFAVSDTINPTQKAIALQDSLKWFQDHK